MAMDNAEGYIKHVVKYVLEVTLLLPFQPYHIVLCDNVFVQKCPQDLHFFTKHYDQTLQARYYLSSDAYESYRSSD
jgi:hypothetical protein